MKIGIVTEYYYPYLGGIAEHVHHTWRQFTSLGHDVAIITPRMRHLRYCAGLSDDAGWAPESAIIRIGESHPFYFNNGFVRFTSPIGLARRLREVFEARRFDIVHVHAPLVPTLPLAALKTADCPVVGTCHTEVPRTAGYRLLHAWFQGFADRLDGCIAVSPTAAGTVERHFDLSCAIIPNGVDLELYHPRNPPAAEFADGRKKNVLFLGRFDPHNGLKVLLEAFPLIRKKAPDTRLIIVGDGPLRRSHERSIPRDMAGDVHFVGMQYLRKPWLYACADVFVNPALYHAQSIVCLEAMASGLPIVASGIPGFKWLMQDDAVYAEPGSSAALAAAIIDTLSNEALSADLRRRSRLRAERFSWEIISGRILRFYDSVLAAKASNHERATHAERRIRREGASQSVR